MLQQKDFLIKAICYLCITNNKMHTRQQIEEITVINDEEFEYVLSHFEIKTKKTPISYSGKTTL
jgi:hypothetical protein